MSALQMEANADGKNVLLMDSLLVRQWLDQPRDKWNFGQKPKHVKRWEHWVLDGRSKDLRVGETDEGTAVAVLNKDLIGIPVCIGRHWVCVLIRPVISEYGVPRKIFLHSHVLDSTGHGVGSTLTDEQLLRIKQGLWIMAKNVNRKGLHGYAFREGTNKYMVNGAVPVQQTPEMAAMCGPITAMQMWAAVHNIDPTLLTIDDAMRIHIQVMRLVTNYKEYRHCLDASAHPAQRTIGWKRRRDMDETEERLRKRLRIWIAPSPVCERESHTHMERCRLQQYNLTLPSHL